MRKLALILILSSTSAYAAALRHWDLDELVRRADDVVAGTVVGQRPVRVDGRLCTESLIAIDRVLFGKARRDLVVTQLGGDDGTEASDWPGLPLLAPHRGVLLLTSNTEDGRTWIVGTALGSFTLENNWLEQRIDATLVGDNGTLAPGPHLRRMHLSDVEAVIARVRR